MPPNFMVHNLNPLRCSRQTVSQVKKKMHFWVKLEVRIWEMYISAEKVLLQRKKRWKDNTKRYWLKQAQRVQRAKHALQLQQPYSRWSTPLSSPFPYLVTTDTPKITRSPALEQLFFFLISRSSQQHCYFTVQVFPCSHLNNLSYKLPRQQNCKIKHAICSNSR